MSKKAKLILASISGLTLTAALIVFIVFVNVRSEFSSYLSTRYPELTFKIGMPRYTILYESYYADATCVNDSTTFRVVSKGPRTNAIHDTYGQIKKINKYNSKLNNIFQNRDINKHILSITGGSQSPFTDGSPYELVSICIVNNEDRASVIKNILAVLQEENILAESVKFTLEDVEHVYEAHLTSKDFNLTEKEIEAKIQKIK